MKRGFTAVELIIIVVVMGGLAAMIYTVTAHDRQNGLRSRCQANLKYLGQGLAQYALDYNGKYPPILVSADAQGWGDVLLPYLYSRQMFQCPSENRLGHSNVEPRQIGFTDYWINARIDRQSTLALRGPAETVLLGEGNDGTDATDARYALHSIPTLWLGNSGRPLYRHLEGANYAFADGHVKWMHARRMEAMNPNASPNGGNYTFALK